jgi:hypothetical protein
VAVPQALFEELRTHLAYECFDVAFLPAPSSAAPPLPSSRLPAALPSLQRSGMHGGAATRAHHHATTVIAAVAQLLGEIRVDERDNEWMYAIAGGADGAGGAKLVHTGDLRAAAATAKALLHGSASVTDVEDFESISATGTPRTGGDRTPGSRLPLSVTNDAFILAADILRHRRRALESLTAGVPHAEAEATVEALEAQLAALLDRAAETLNPVAAAIRDIVAHNPLLDKSTPGAR